VNRQLTLNLLNSYKTGSKNGCPISISEITGSAFLTVKNWDGYACGLTKAVKHKCQWNLVVMAAGIIHPEVRWPKEGRIDVNQATCCRDEKMKHALILNFFCIGLEISCRSLNRTNVWSLMLRVAQFGHRSGDWANNGLSDEGLLFCCIERNTHQVKKVSGSESFISRKNSHTISQMTGMVFIKRCWRSKPINQSATGLVTTALPLLVILYANVRPKGTGKFPD